MNDACLKGKRVAVVGMDKSGLAAAQFLLNRGAQVRITDSLSNSDTISRAQELKAMGARVELGRHTERFLIGTDLLVTSPGVANDSLPLLFAHNKRILIYSEIKLASLFCKGLVIGVTGSNGKTTTCHLIHEMLKGAGKKSVLCGNVGFPFLTALKTVTKQTFVVLELSSFQLEYCRQFSPQIAVILNISPNHLNRHKSMRDYIKAKALLLKYQSKEDHAVLNYDDIHVRNMARKAKSKVLFFSKKPLREGIFVKNGNVILKDGRKERVLADLKHVRLKGDHNIENMLAGMAVMQILKIPSGFTRKAFESFETLEHRIESLGQARGVEFINDSKSTTVDSTRAAILACSKPLVLIAGGLDKGTPFTAIEPLLREKVKAAVLYGEARNKMAGAWKSFKPVHLVKDFTRAVKTGFSLAGSGESLLLSPMAASFDQFSGFEERGRAFKTIFRQLKAKYGNIKKS